VGQGARGVGRAAGAGLAGPEAGGGQRSGAAWQEGLPLLDERRLAVEPCLAQPVVHCELVVRARDREQAVGCRGVRCVSGRHSDGRPPGDSGVGVLVLGGGGRRAARTDSHRRETTLGQEPAQNATVIAGLASRTRPVNRATYWRSVGSMTRSAPSWSPPVCDRPQGYAVVYPPRGEDLRGASGVVRQGGPVFGDEPGGAVTVDPVHRPEGLPVAPVPAHPTPKRPLRSAHWCRWARLTGTPPRGSCANGRHRGPRGGVRAISNEARRERPSRRSTVPTT